MTLMKSRCWLPVFAVTLLAGCQAMDFGGASTISDKLSWTRSDEKLKASEFETPVRLISIWSDAMYNQPGQVPTRGFGGRLYFYNAKDKAVPVEGQLIVYAYDESPDGTPAKAPSRRFGFTPEQFTSHYSETELGASYSVWIPWDQVGGIRKAITLLPVFTSTGGHVVMGEQSINVLPGKAPENPQPARKGYFTPLSSHEPQTVRPVAYDQPQTRADLRRDSWQQTHTFEPDMQNLTRPRSTTIPLPMTMARRLVANSAAAPGAQLETPDGGNRSGLAAHMPDVPSEPDTAPTATGEAPPPVTHFARPRFPAPRVQAAPLSPVRVGTTLHRAAPQLGPPSPRPTDPSSSAAEFVPDASGRADWDR